MACQTYSAHRLTTTTAAQHDIPISYSPDGSRILYWRGPGNIEYTTSAHWSPTGDWIVFDKINAAAGGHTFYLVHPDGSGTKIIPSLTSVCCAVWSPDGNRLLFPKGTTNLGVDLWTVMIDGSHLTRLTHAPAHELTDLGWTKAAT